MLCQSQAWIKEEGSFSFTAKLNSENRSAQRALMSPLWLTLTMVAAAAILDLMLTLLRHGH